MILKHSKPCRKWKSLLDSVNSGIAPRTMDLGPLQTHLALCSGCRNAINETGNEILRGCRDYRDLIDRVNLGEDLPGEEFDLFWMHLGFCRRCRNRLKTGGKYDTKRYF
jgi:hypothetical protein